MNAGEGHILPPGFEQIDEIFKKPKTTELDIAAVISGVIGIASVAASFNGNVKALAYIAASNIDNAGDALLAHGERSKIVNPKRFLKLRKWASYLILTAQLSVIGSSAYGLANNERPTVSEEDLVLSGLGVASNAAIFALLRKNAIKGTAHRDAYRHAFIDTVGNAAAGLAIFASSSLFPVVDSVAGIVIPAATVGMTWLTSGRLAPQLYLGNQTSSNGSGGIIGDQDA